MLSASETKGLSEEGAEKLKDRFRIWSQTKINERAHDGRKDVTLKEEYPFDKLLQDKEFMKQFRLELKRLGFKTKYLTPGVNPGEEESSLKISW